MSKVIVMGASENPARVSNTAIKRLLSAGWDVIPVNTKVGIVSNISFITDYDSVDVTDLNTITMYVGAKNQTSEMIDFILNSKPKRIIFNPGAENNVLEKLASDAGIETIEACTLTMLALRQF